MQITILLTYEMSDSWCISVLQQLEPYQMARSVFWCMASSGFWNKLAALHVLSFIFCYSTKDCHLKEDVREDRIMCYVWGKCIERVEFYLSISPCPHLVAGFSLVFFQRPESHDSVTSVPFRVPQKLFPPFHTFIMLLNMKRETPLKRKVGSQIRAGFGNLQKLCGLRFCFTRAGSPGQVLATFLSLVAAGVCPPFHIRTAVLVPLVDLGEELKQFPVPTGWGDLAFIRSIEMKFCAHLLWTIGMDHWGRHFQRLG